MSIFKSISGFFSSVGNELPNVSIASISLGKTQTTTTPTTTTTATSSRPPPTMTSDDNKSLNPAFRGDVAKAQANPEEFSHRRAEGNGVQNQLRDAKTRESTKASEDRHTGIHIESRDLGSSPPQGECKADVPTGFLENLEKSETTHAGSRKDRQEMTLETKDQESALASTEQIEASTAGTQSVIQSTSGQPQVDLSYLNEEERLKIESVMARARRACKEEGDKSVARQSERGKQSRRTGDISVTSQESNDVIRTCHKNLDKNHGSPDVEDSNLTEFEKNCFSALDAFLSDAKEQTNKMAAKVSSASDQSQITNQSVVIQRSNRPIGDHLTTSASNQIEGRMTSTNRVTEKAPNEERFQGQNGDDQMAETHPSRKQPPNSLRTAPLDEDQLNSVDMVPDHHEADIFSSDMDRKDFFSSFSSSSEESLSNKSRDKDNSKSADDSTYTYDLASFAASVYTGTEQLMGFGVSPPESNFESFSKRVLESSEELLSSCHFDPKTMPKHLSSTPLNHTGGQSVSSQRNPLSDNEEEMESYAQTQAAKAAKLLPLTASDWSPIRDLLYPILDVSPSVERKEQDIPEGEGSGPQTPKKSPSRVNLPSSKSITPSSSTSFKRCPSFSNIPNLTPQESLDETKLSSSKDATEAPPLLSLKSKSLGENSEKIVVKEPKAQIEYPVESIPPKKPEKRFPGQLTPVENDSDTELDLGISKFNHQDPPDRDLDSPTGASATSWFSKSSLFGNNVLLNNRNLLVPESDEPMVFVSSDEDREIDLDEDIPPKPVLGKRSSKETSDNFHQTPSKETKDVVNALPKSIKSSDKPSVIEELRKTDFKPAESPKPAIPPREEPRRPKHSSYSVVDKIPPQESTPLQNRGPAEPHTRHHDRQLSDESARPRPMRPAPPVRQMSLGKDDKSHSTKKLRGSTESTSIEDDVSNRRDMEAVNSEFTNDKVGEVTDPQPRVKVIIKNFENVPETKDARESSPIRQSSTPKQASSTEPSKVKPKEKVEEKSRNETQLATAHKPTSTYQVDKERPKPLPKPQNVTSETKGRKNDKNMAELKANTEEDTRKMELDPKSTARMAQSSDKKGRIEDRKDMRSVVEPTADSSAEDAKRRAAPLRTKPMKPSKNYSEHGKAPSLSSSKDRQIRPAPNHYTRTNSDQNHSTERGSPIKKFRKPTSSGFSSSTLGPADYRKGGPPPHRHPHAHKSPQRRNMPLKNGSDPMLAEHRGPEEVKQSPLEMGLKGRSPRPQSHRFHSSSSSDQESSNEFGRPFVEKRSAVSMQGLNDVVSASPYHGYYPDLSHYHANRQPSQQHQQGSSPSHQHHHKGLPNSQSLSSLPLMPNSDDVIYPPISFAYVTEGSQRQKQEKLMKLQEEIEKRRFHLTELSRSQLADRPPSKWFTKPAASDYRKPPHLPPADGSNYQMMAGGSPMVKHRYMTGTGVDQPSIVPYHPSDPSEASFGVIKPIDYQINPSDDYYVAVQPPPRAPPPPTPPQPSVYSSFEYLAHKSGEAAGYAPYQFMTSEKRLIGQYLDQKSMIESQSYQQKGQQPIYQQPPSQRRPQQHYMDKSAKRRSDSEYAGMLSGASYYPTFKGSLGYLNSILPPEEDVYGVPPRAGDVLKPSDPTDEFGLGRTAFYPEELELSRQTFADIMALNATFASPDNMFEQQIDVSLLGGPVAPGVGGMVLQRADVPLSGRGDVTPAMTILDDVPSRTRNILRDIGSRPLSDDLEKYFQGEEPTVGLLLREESENSVAESNDDFVMEGGVTIKMQMEKKRRLPDSVVEKLNQKYNFDTKRVLFTPDMKDKNFGLKIVSGKTLGLTGEDESGAYLLCIYPGSVADQLLGELHEGDQVLEWNGDPLSGKKDPEILHIMSKTSGEVELVIKCNANSGTHPSNTMSTFTSSGGSSFDNMQGVSDYGTPNLTPSSMRKDANLLEDLPSRDSPHPTMGSSKHSSVPSPCPMPQKIESNQSISSTLDSIGRSSRQPQLSIGGKERSEGHSTPSNRQSLQRQESEHNLGEIMLQMSYDDFDGSLNVHVIRAKNIQPIRKGNTADAFVKVVMLPFKNIRDKKKTKPVEKSLSPEWNRTLVFIGLERAELQERALEISVWDHDRFLPNAYVGEVVLELSNDSILDDKPHWYRLRSEDSHSNFGRRPRSSLSSDSQSSTPSRSMGSGSVQSSTRGGQPIKSPQKESSAREGHFQNLRKETSSSSIEGSKFKGESKGQGSDGEGQEFLKSSGGYRQEDHEMMMMRREASSSTDSDCGEKLWDRQATLPLQRKQQQQQELTRDTQIQTSQSQDEPVTTTPNSSSLTQSRTGETTPLSRPSTFEPEVKIKVKEKTEDQCISDLESSSQELDRIFQELSETSRDIQKTIEEKKSASIDLLEKKQAEEKMENNSNEDNDLKSLDSSCSIDEAFRKASIADGDLGETFKKVTRSISSKRPFDLQENSRLLGDVALKESNNGDIKHSNVSTPIDELFRDARRMEATSGKDAAKTADQECSKASNIASSIHGLISSLACCVRPRQQNGNGETKSPLKR